MKSTLHLREFHSIEISGETNEFSKKILFAILLSTGIFGSITVNAQVTAQPVGLVEAMGE